MQVQLRIVLLLSNVSASQWVMLSRLNSPGQQVLTIPTYIHSMWSDIAANMMDIRPERWIVTIPSFDQWLATIEKPSSPMVARPKTIAKPSSPMVARLKKHRGQWLIDQKPLKNHWYQWFLPNHSFNGNGDPENHWCFTMVAITVQKLPALGD